VVHLAGRRRERTEPPVHRWFSLDVSGTHGGWGPGVPLRVPVLLARLLLITPVTAMLGVAVAIAVVGMWQDGRTSTTARLAHSLVAIALLSFIVFAWYWHLMPTKELVQNPSPVVAATADSFRMACQPKLT
jgi:hypothetical protein